MSGGGTTVQTASSSPWGGYVGDPDYKGTKNWGQAPHLIKGFEGAEELLKGGLPEYYQGPTMAGFAPARPQRSRLRLATQWVRAQLVCNRVQRAH